MEKTKRRSLRRRRRTPEKTQQTKQPDQPTLTVDPIPDAPTNEAPPKKVLEVDPLFKLSPRERARKLEKQSEVDPLLTNNQRKLQLAKFADMGFRELSTLLATHQNDLSAMERAHINMINLSQGKTKAAVQAYNMVYDRLHGKAVQKNELSGPDGQPLHIRGDYEKAVEVDLTKLTKEEREQFKRLAMLKMKTLGTWEEEQDNNESVK